jgi:hypothetical protein
MTPERRDELKGICLNATATLFMDVSEILWLLAEVERLEGEVDNRDVIIQRLTGLPEHRTVSFGGGRITQDGP